MGYIHRLCVAVILVAMFVGCGGNPPADIPPPTNLDQPTAWQFNLPAPVDALSLIPDRTSSALLLERNGSEYITGLEQRITHEEPSARFSPAWIDGSSGFDNLAYAIYNFNVQTYFGAELVTLGWGEVPQDYSHLWVGLGDWNSDSWDWHPGPSDGLIDLQSVGYSDYTKPATGDMLVAVVMLGVDQVLLDRLSVGEAETEQGDWPMFGHDRRHTRRSPYIGAQTNNVKWSRYLGTGIWSSPAIGLDGTVYVGNDGKIFALNPDSSFKWSYPLGGGVRSSPAIGADGTVYVGSYDNKLYAINADGTEKWSYTTGDDVISSPTIGADGTVYVGCDDNKLYAINPDGSLKWSYTTMRDVDSSPAIGVDGTVYVGCDYDNFYAINPDGSLKWSITLSMMSTFMSSPAIGADGTVYVGSAIYLYAINPDGSLKWSYSRGRGGESSPAIGADGTVYVGSYDEKLYAINPDGTEKWSFAAGDNVLSSPAIGADGTVYVGSNDHKVYAINPDGSLKWSYTTGDDVRSSPAIGADGTVFVGSWDDNLYAFGE